MNPDDPPPDAVVVLVDETGERWEMPARWLHTPVVDYFEVSPRANVAGLVKFDPAEIVWNRHPSPLAGNPPVILDTPGATYLPPPAESAAEVTLSMAPLADTPPLPAELAGGLIRRREGVP